jgi:hypothetical protein
MSMVKTSRPQAPPTVTAMLDGEWVGRRVMAEHPRRARPLARPSFPFGRRQTDSGFSLFQIGTSWARPLKNSGAMLSDR